MTRGQRTLSLVACLCTIMLAILDQNIVSAATVPIVHDLDPAHGLDLLPWLVSAYALAATACLPLYGKLCDVYGARRVFISAVAVFLAGSALCGASQNMSELIAFRAVQGIGGGGLMSVTMVVVVQLSTSDDKSSGDGRNALAGVVAGLGLAVGPLIGGVLTDSVDWRWIFYVNLPLGVMVLVVAATAMRRLPHHGRRHRIDYPGAALVAAATCGVLLVAEWGGRRYAWDSPVVVGLGVASAVLVALFVWRQTTAAEPILPLTLFRNATLRVAVPIQALLGVVMTGSIVYVMVYLQEVRGFSPTIAGLHLIPTAVGMALAGAIARFYPSTRRLVVVGGICLLAGTAMLGTTGPATPIWRLLLALFVFGAGLGHLIGQLIVVSQRAAPITELGVVTTAVRFGQTLGGVFGASIFGTVLTRVVGHRSSPAAFTSGIDTVFLCDAGVSALIIGCAFLLRDPPAVPVEAAPVTDVVVGRSA
jgi:EmrB/QacA subfamily drug resistance transporter